MFPDRTAAGKMLAEKLTEFKGKNALVLAVPRGGVMLGYEVAKALEADLDVIIPRKIGAPYNPELAIGAVIDDDTVVLDDELIEVLHVPEEFLDKEINKQKSEVSRRYKVYRGNLPPREVRGRDVILADDGIATGSTMTVAIRSLRKKEPRSIILAVPVAPHETIDRMRSEVDKVICLQEPKIFYAVSQFYTDFGQTTDEEVISLISQFNFRNMKPRL